jgi:ribonuclease P protein component
VTGRAKRGRLTRSADFERVYRQGRSHGNRYFVLYAFPRSGEGEARLGVSVSRKVGGAVDRNKVKRLLREAVTAAEASIPEGIDIVVVARPDARELAEREGLAGVRTALDELVEKAAAAHAAPSDKRASGQEALKGSR